MGPEPARRYREQAAPWPLHAFGLFVATFGSIGAYQYSGGDRIGAAILVAVIVGVMVWDVARCRRVELDGKGLAVGDQRFVWADLEVPHFREVPLARAGMFVRVTDEARTRLQLPEPRHRLDGIGLVPADTSGKRYDLFLRARRDQLEEWHDFVLLHLLYKMGDQLEAVRATLAATPTSRQVDAELIMLGDDSATIELRARSIAALMAAAAPAIAGALPEDARWNPSCTRSVMVLVGPLELADDPQASAALDHIKACVKSSVVGTPRAIAAMFAARASRPT